MDLTVGTQWGGFMGAKVIGVADVTVGSQSWRCLKVTGGGSQHYKSPTGKPIAIADLRYWSVARQEAYADASASLARHLECLAEAGKK